MVVKLDGFRFDEFWDVFCRDFTWWIRDYFIWIWDHFIFMGYLAKS
jgi:hypothetical protein